jgi:hypothetical protein
LIDQNPIGKTGAFLRLTLIADEKGFTNWLHGFYPQPNATSDPKDHQVWLINDHSLKVFMLCHVSYVDNTAVSYLPTSSSIFDELHKRHKNLSVHTQVMLMQKALKLWFCPGIPLSQTADKMDALHRCIVVAIGPIDNNKLCLVFFLNGLREFFPLL